MKQPFEGRREAMNVVNGIECDICGYTSETAVYVCSDGVARCKVCRRKLQYGHWVSDDEADRRKERGDYNPRYEPDADATMRAIKNDTRGP